MKYLYALLILAALAGAFYCGKRFVVWLREGRSTLKKTVDRL